MINKFSQITKKFLEVKSVTKKKVAVAMSGGVDSSLTAAILLERGFEVIGVTMQLKDEVMNLYANDNQCCSANEAGEARRTADFLHIPHYIINFREQFQEKVVKYFIGEYLKGRTPNPCVACNKYIKFGALFDFVNEMGADFLATGHYAKIDCIDGKYYLKKGLDLKKDQSYVLYNVKAEQLSKIILPLGNQSKQETRLLAEKLNLPVAHKPDSQEICFVPNDDYKTFLNKNADKNSEALQAGNIVDLTGKILGKHKGAAFYTIGQRKGLGIAAEKPLFVTKLDILKRQVIVGGAEDVFSNSLIANNLNWIYPQNLPLKASAKIRYGFKTAECTVEKLDDDSVKVVFDIPQRAITIGQSIVFYDDDIVLGGGIIDKVFD